jgi:tetratricopeptide (TPR) repeat protein
MNFAADDKQAKLSARIMLQMTANINQSYVARVEGTGVRVECVTCHRGLTSPRPLKAVLEEKIDKEGIEAGVSLYNELRGRYLGSGQYDFGETTLNQLTEDLLANSKTREAVTVMELSFKANHPDSVWSYHMLAMAHQANGQLQEAVADYKKALAQHPDDKWAESQVDELSKKLQK